MPYLYRQSLGEKYFEIVPMAFRTTSQPIRPLHLGRPNPNSINCAGQLVTQRAIVGLQIFPLGLSYWTKIVFPKNMFFHMHLESSWARVQYHASLCSQSQYKFTKRKSDDQTKQYPLKQKLCTLLLLSTSKSKLILPLKSFSVYPSVRP